MPASPVEVRLVAQIFLSLDGAPVEAAVRNNLRYCYVDSAVDLPDLATLRFNNSEFSLMEPEQFKMGQVLEVELGDSALKRRVFKGEVTSLEVELGIDGDFGLIVRALDRAHRLHRGRYTRSFLDKSDSDIAMDIARELSLESEVDSSGERYEYVLQDNLTNWEFLQERAARIGFELQVSDNKLVFKKPPSVPAEPITLALRRHLLSFHARMTTGEQVNEVEVRGWDPVEKQEVTGTAKRPDHLPEIGVSQTGGEVASGAFHSDAKVVVARQPIYSRAQADQLAQAVLDDLSSAFITAEGVAMGDPKLRLGSKVNIEAVGQQFSGKYVVTKVRHRYEQEGYRIEFEVTGRRSTDMVSLLQSPEQPKMHFLNGLVTNNQDPLDIGRVKVRLPQLAADVESGWCRVVTPDAGDERGIQFTPEVDDEVLVMGSDISQLYVMGSLWSRQDRPPLGRSDVGPGGTVNKRIIKTREGHFLQFDDTRGAGGIQLVDYKGNKIVFDSGTNSLEINFAGNMKIHANQSIEISAGQSIKIDAGTDLEASASASGSVTARAGLDLQGAEGVSVQSSARVAVIAPNVSLG